MNPPSPAAPRHRLVPSRGTAIAVATVAWIAFTAMALWLRDSRDPTALDNSVWTWLLAHTGRDVQAAMLALSEPILTVGGCAVVAICALLTQRWRLAVLAVAGPLAGLLLESHVFKPWIDRRFGLTEVLSHGAVEAGYGYPSGHQTGLTSLTCLLVVVLLASGLSRRAKITVGVVLAVWTVVGALGLVRSGYHYFTDTLGGIALAVGLIVTFALVIDAVGGRFSSPVGRARTRTVPAA